MPEEVIELSVHETNALRAKLGLKPLQINKPPTSDSTRSDSGNINSSNNEELSLSIDESNALRQKLGLQPLKMDGNNQAPNGRKSSEAIHAPAQNTTEQDRIIERVAEAKLKREVEAGIAKLKQDSKESHQDLDALGWADRMRAQTQAQAQEVSKKKKKRALKNDTDADADADADARYTDAEFENQNLTVSHNTSDFQQGSTTVLTMKDTSILEDGGNELENVNMSESATVQDNLKRKRNVELGLGHAGGYAGYDDDEFEELGGSQMTLGIDSSKGGTGSGESQKDTRGGFQLSGTIAETKKEKKGSDLFATFQGKSVSLLSSGENANDYQADYMTYEEEEATGVNVINKEETERKRRKKEKKLMKKLKKDKKKSRKESKEQGSKQDQPSEGGMGVVEGNNLLKELAASSKEGKNKRRRRRRRVESDSDDSGDETNMASNIATHASNNAIESDDVDMKDEDEALQEKRNGKFHTIMEKGNHRTKEVFASQDKGEQNSPGADNEIEEDDAFLSAAISKARRLRRLRELNAKSNGHGSSANASNEQSKGADAVVQALQSIKKFEHGNGSMNNSSNLEGKITFELGTTTEFTRALRAQPIKSDDSNQHTQTNPSNHVEPPSQPQISDKIEVEDVIMEVEEENEDEGIQTLEELADQVKEDTTEAFGSTGAMAGVGRGMSAFLGMLKQTGEIKTAGREELRGRAKDERTYEDYAPTDLKEVVKVDTTGLRGKRPDKDIEFANREIKLEYRDDHGRLLTRKEAYRQLCYQFHGHGSSKKKEEKRLQQIEREQSEKSANSGTLGALKATQKATGKAFLLHKT